jgi:hypothetical protein
VLNLLFLLAASFILNVLLFTFGTAELDIIASHSTKLAIAEKADSKCGKQLNLRKVSEGVHTVLFIIKFNINFKLNYTFV